MRIEDKSGFTLLEVILVLFIISLVFGMATIFFSNTMPSNKLNATAREISAAIRYARTLALVNNEKQTLTIDLDSRFYGIEGSLGKNIPNDINIKIIDPLLGDVVKGKYSFSFYESGGIEGGTIVLSIKKKIVNIELDPVVGSVIIR
ncbi:MAG: prepilin-type N-terminal cleavage/methylation domain-containing protein [Nitrospirae bacterium]|nr:prepilin-type N-terminal cleavage/methylation domain-containing protein [Nitrospirota bacterium]